jgi:hypothetical protein
MRAALPGPMPIRRLPEITSCAPSADLAQQAKSEIRNICVFAPESPVQPPKCGIFSAILFFVFSEF